jgi:hypothetical protein
VGPNRIPLVQRFRPAERVYSAVRSHFHKSLNDAFFPYDKIPMR